jgi:hypothetical protein
LSLRGNVGFGNGDERSEDNVICITPHSQLLTRTVDSKRFAEELGTTVHLKMLRNIFESDFSPHFAFFSIVEDDGIF